MASMMRNIVKFLISAFAVTSFCLSELASAEVFYCSASTQAGISWDTKTTVGFKPDRFKLKVDFDANTLHSPEAGLYYEEGFGTVCSKKYFSSDNTEYIHCSSNLGVGLMFNVSTYQFTRAVYVDGQDMFVGYGSCELF